jgi:phosphoesterase RecJ-like protein
MDEQIKKQIFDIVGKSQKIFIALPKNPNGDTLGSGLAFAAFLRKLNKEVDVFSEKEDFGNLSFLPHIDQIKHEVVLPKSFVVSVSTANTKLEEISYHPVGDDKVNIYLKPKAGEFKAEDVTFGDGVSGYDLIVMIDVPSLEHLGNLYTKNTEIFFNTSKINIDNHINNENYGNINLVDITASSSAEILLDLLKAYEENLIDEDIATLLLTGIIAETNSFQLAQTTPNSFMKASELISYGAKQQEIVHHLFKTRDLSVLKLWGRAMARIKALTEYETLFTVVGKQDIEKSSASESDLYQVFLEFVNNVADIRLLFFVAERDTDMEMYIHAHPNVKLDEVVNFFGGEVIAPSTGRVVITGKEITDVENILVEGLKKLRPSLGL